MCWKRTYCLFILRDFGMFMTRGEKHGKEDQFKFKYL